MPSHSLRRWAADRYGANPLQALAMLACFSLAGYAGGRPGDLPVAASDVEHVVAFADRCRGEKRLVEAAVHGVVAVPVPGPMDPFVAVSRLGLLGVDDSCVLGAHWDIASLRSSAKTWRHPVLQNA
jgi:hypothetical protein